MISTLTSKGQMTLPKAAREHLRVKPGDQVKMFNLPDGTTVLLPVRPVNILRGIVKSPGGRPATLEEMDDAIAKGAVESLGIVPRPEVSKLKIRREKRRK